ncbi:MAG: hypothetical protein ABEK10_02525 [Candidatus Nanosalina sp.]
MSTEEDRLQKGFNFFGLYTAWFKAFTPVSPGRPESNPEQASESPDSVNGKENEINGWKIRTSSDVRELVEKGAIQEPEEYGFDFREMKRFLRGSSRSEASNSFRPNRREERKYVNEDSPRDVSYEDTVAAFPEVFYDAEEVKKTQRAMEAVQDCGYWSVRDGIQRILEEFENLAVEGEATLNLYGSNGDELELEFWTESGIETRVEAEYSEGDNHHLFEFPAEDLPERLEDLGQER